MTLSCLMAHPVEVWTDENEPVRCTEQVGHSGDHACMEFREGLTWPARHDP